MARRINKIPKDVALVTACILEYKSGNLRIPMLDIKINMQPVSNKETDIISIIF
jgi:hypothetical protein